MAYQDEVTQEELQAGFDAWAQTYDRDVGMPSDNFPFAGYAQALQTVWEQAQAEPGMTVLDLGVGTGNLSGFFVEAGCQVLGADFSAEMLARAQEKLPQLALVQVNLTEDEWPPAFNRRFDRIVSNYTFHEFSLQTKLHILSRLAERHLAPNGRIVIGDIMFPTVAALNKAREALSEEWEDEFFWSTDETRELFEPAGWVIEYFPVSFCAGVYLFKGPAAAK